MAWYSVGGVGGQEEGAPAFFFLGGGCWGIVVSWRGCCCCFIVGVMREGKGHQAAATMGGDATRDEKEWQGTAGNWRWRLLRGQVEVPLDWARDCFDTSYTAEQECAI
jgi:hypothetical protein